MMRKNFLLLVFFFLLAVSCRLFAANTVPAMIVAPFTNVVTLSKSTTANVRLVVQNNSGVNLTITDLVAQIPVGSSVTASLIYNGCGFLAPKQTCEATAELRGLTRPGNENLNVSVCSFGGALCSRIRQPVTVINAPLTAIEVSPASPVIAAGTTVQFYATGIYEDNSTQDITGAVTWQSSDVTKATISDTGVTKGLATGIAAGSTAISAALNGLSGSAALTVNAATLTSIVVTPADESIATGTSRQFYATGIYSDDSHQDLTSQVVWSSSNQAMVTISNTSGSKGMATGESSGLATITATMGVISGSAQLTVTAATLSSISVTPDNADIAVGTTQQFSATGIYSDNTTEDLTADVTWNTGSALTAIISNRPVIKGLALGLSGGSTTVSATLGNISGETGLTVSAAVLSGINISPTNQSIIAGETQQYTATGIYTDFSTKDLTDEVTWHSSDTAVSVISNASPTNGLAKGMAAGEATISATEGDISDSTALTVAPVTLQSIAVTPATPTIADGTQQQFVATGTYSDASTMDLTNQVTWISTAPAIAVISNVEGSEGLATGVAAGATVIRAVFSGVSGSATLTVTPAILTSIAVTPASATLPDDTTAQFTATGTYSDASVKVMTDEVTWRSANTAIATVSNAASSKGLVTANRAGSTTISAIQDGVTGSTSLAVASLAIGDSFGGGKVACLSGGLNNLVTANANNSTGIVWGGSGTRTNAQSEVDGQANTTKIVSVLGAGTSYAAGLCDAYEIDSAGNSPCVGGNVCYNDWFLPSVNQLNCLRSHRNQIGGFGKTLYWSSTENSCQATTKALALTFANSGHHPESSSKTQSYPVRCVRLLSAFP